MNRLRDGSQCGLRPSGVIRHCEGPFRWKWPEAISSAAGDCFGPLRNGLGPRNDGGRTDRGLSMTAGGRTGASQ